MLTTKGGLDDAEALDTGADDDLRWKLIEGELDGHPARWGPSSERSAGPSRSAAVLAWCQ